MSNRLIEVIGARENNLQDLTCAIPQNSFTVVTGPSGAGKSSLVFDVLVQESRHRVEYARALSQPQIQFEKIPPHPQVTEIRSLPLAIGIRPEVFVQRHTTVSTLSGLAPLLQILFSRFGTRTCLNCHAPLRVANRVSVVEQIAPLAEGRLVTVSAVFLKIHAAALEKILQKVLKSGFVRGAVDDSPARFDEASTWDTRKDEHSLKVTIDQFAFRAGQEARLGDAVDLAFGFSDADAVVEVEQENEKAIEVAFSSRWKCHHCGVDSIALIPEDFLAQKYHELSPHALATQYQGVTLQSLMNDDVRQAAEVMRKLREQVHLEIISKVLLRMSSLLDSLCDVGLGYLNLGRSARTLSGGEALRVHLVRHADSLMSGVLFAIDEPSFGLHPRDTKNLIQWLRKLQSRENTVVVVEHDSQMIAESDHVLELGPGGGKAGGKLTYSGKPQKESDLFEAETSSQKKQKTTQRQTKLRLRNVSVNNLQIKDIEIPLSQLVAVVGVSGSGKSSFIFDALLPLVRRHLRERRRAEHLSNNPKPAGKLVSRNSLSAEISGWESIRQVVSLQVLGRSRGSRSSVASAVGVLSGLRDLYALLPAAKMRGLSTKDFRAPFQPAALEVRFRNRTLDEVMHMTVGQAFELFTNVPKIAEPLKCLVELGLEYFVMEQAVSSLSLGERQRLRLARFLPLMRAGTLLLLDEPTRGLDKVAVQKLVQQLSRCFESGVSIIVAEHNLAFIRSASHVIELGPGPGAEGGQVVAFGTPKKVNEESHSSFSGILFR